MQTSTHSHRQVSEASVTCGLLLDASGSQGLVGFLAGDDRCAGALKRA